MDPQMLQVSDWVTASGAYTLPTMNIVQALKQSSHVRNSWCWWLAALSGLFLALGWLVCTGLLYWDNGVVLVNPLQVYQGVLQGLYGGLVAPVAYQVQKLVPEAVRPFQAAPDNHPADAAAAAAKLAAQPPTPTQV